MDREQSVEVLKTAFVQGRLTKDELDARVGQALASRTRAELAAVTSDLPAEPTAPHPRQPARPRPQQPRNAAVKRGARIIAAATVLTAGVWAAALASNNAALLVLLWSFTFTWIGTVLVAGAAMIDSRLQNRSGGQLPRRRHPGAGGLASRRAGPVARAGELPQADRDPRARAEAAPRRPSRPRYSVSCAAEALFRSRCRPVAGQLP